MKKTLRWMAVNTAMFALMVIAFTYQNSNAYNVFACVIWLNLLVSLPLLSDEVKRAIAKKGRSVPAVIDYWFDVSVLCFLAWYGAFFLFAAYLISTLLQIAAWKEIDDYEKAKEVEA